MTLSLEDIIDLRTWVSDNIKLIGENTFLKINQIFLCLQQKFYF